MKVRLTKAAIRDLREALAYIAADNPKAAAQTGLRLDKAIALIAERPNIGRRSAGQDIYEWSVPGLPYVIPYRISDDTIEIIRVYHTSRQRPS